jgi:hypothetical protein
VMKKILIFLIFASNAFSQTTSSGKARGLFFSFGVGPRIPVSDFADSHVLGFGINADVSYTDNEYLPLFFYGRIGFEHYPGSVDFYRRTDYSAISTNVVPMNFGFKLFFPPVVEDIVLLIPTVEMGLSFAIYEKLHQFKIESGKNSYLEETTKLGFQVGAGFSMFLIDVMAFYNYYFGNQNISADIKLRIPIFIKL